MAENESLDGATTALHRRIEELTEELADTQTRCTELLEQGSVALRNAKDELDKADCYRVNAEAEVARMRSALGVERIRLGECEANAEILRHDLATERAAREQAEKDHGEAQNRLYFVERERDTALALSTERYQELCRQAQRATDAETALASAQHRIAELEAYGNDCCARAVSGAVGNHLHRIAQLETALASARADIDRIKSTRGDRDDWV
ncbi:MAG TPA: hypothetical protein VFS67_30750, partial [Polyangiaceae bacterium]|nr:hypothetical protein [Polyangiaceae bacterium]